MNVIYILSILFFILGLILKFLNNKNKTNNNYKIIKSPMTETEIKFYNKLLTVTNKYNLIIIPQIQLQKIFKTKNISDFNKIKSKSIDFAIIDNKFHYKCFIELDDYTHEYKNRKKRDLFINELFNNYNLKLIRIKVNNEYNIEQLENKIKECL